MVLAHEMAQQRSRFRARDQIVTQSLEMSERLLLRGIELETVPVRMFTHPVREIRAIAQLRLVNDRRVHQV
jgi:hypothetical protein